MTYFEQFSPSGAASITSGTINNTVIGGTTPAAGTFTALTATGDTLLGDADSDVTTVRGSLRLADDDNSNYAAIQAPSNITTNYTLTLPVDDGTSGQFLQTDGNGVLSWATGGASGAASITSGTINGTTIGGTTPAAGSFTTLTSTGASTLNSLSVTNNATIGGTLDVTGNQTNTGDLTVNGNTALGNADTDVTTVRGTLRLADDDASNFAIIQAPATITTNYTLTLPADDGTAGQVLSTDGSGVLSWITAGGSSSLSGLTAASATNSISNSNFAQTWNWNTLTTETALAVTANTQTTGTALNLSSSSNSLTSGSLLKVQYSGSPTALSGNLVDISYSNATGSTGNFGTLLKVSTAAATGRNQLIVVNDVQTASLVPATNFNSANAGAPSSGIFSFNATGAHTGAGLRLLSNTVTGNAAVITTGADRTSGATLLVASNGITTAGSSTSATAVTITMPAATVNTLRYIRIADVAGTEIGSINNTNATTTAFATTSDARLKEDTGYAPQGLDDLEKIKVRNFTWKRHAEISAQDGFFAQELHEIVPVAVTVGDDAIGEDGYPTNPWSVDYAKLTPILVKAVQELSAKVKELEARL